MSHLTRILGNGCKPRLYSQRMVFILKTKYFTDNSRLGLSPYLQLKVGILYRAVSVDPSPLNYPSLSRLPFDVLAHWRLVD